MTASDWLMRGPFQGIEADPALYAVRHPPMGWDLPATEISRRPHWMTHWGMLQTQRVYGVLVASKRCALRASLPETVARCVWRGRLSEALWGRASEQRQRVRLSSEFPILASTSHRSRPRSSGPQASHTCHLSTACAR
jgi:hypothetical protein